MQAPPRYRLYVSRETAHKLGAAGQYISILQQLRIIEVVGIDSRNAHEFHPGMLAELPVLEDTTRGLKTSAGLERTLLTFYSIAQGSQGASGPPVRAPPPPPGYYAPPPQAASAPPQYGAGHDTRFASQAGPSSHYGSGTVPGVPLPPAPAPYMPSSGRVGAIIGGAPPMASGGSRLTWDLEMERGSSGTAEGKVTEQDIARMDREREERANRIMSQLRPPQQGVGAMRYQ